MKIVSKLILTLESDTETGETRLLNREVKNDDLAHVRNSITVSEKHAQAEILQGNEPLLELDTNKYRINEVAAAILGLKPGDKLHINYPKRDGEYCPAIGSSKAFNVQAGNKLTQKYSVSYRGEANTKLATFGTLFKFEETSRKGIYYLIGDKQPVEEPKADEVVEINDSLELDDLSTLSVGDPNSIDLSNLDLTL